jgi:hypothetical protein
LNHSLHCEYLCHFIFNVEHFHASCDSLYFSTMQHQTGRNHNHNGVVNAKATLDLIIVDLPEGLPVPTVSSPWNESVD